MNKRTVKLTVHVPCAEWSYRFQRRFPADDNSRSVIATKSRSCMKMRRNFDVFSAKFFVRKSPQLNCDPILKIQHVKVIQASDLEIRRCKY